jgi:AcrR family transcriptional regulator
LAERLRVRLADGAAPRPSFRELAAAAGVGVSTLRHYFGDREQLVRDVLEIHGPGAARHLAFLREPQAPFGASILAACAYVAVGLRQPVVAELHTLGLAEGLGRPAMGATYLTAILEPMIEALEARLAAHVARGDMRPTDARAAALSLISPVVLAHLHQAALGGSQTRPLRLDEFLQDHCAGFVRAYEARPQ